MQTISLPIEQLEAHPANSNVMPEELLAKLADHVERTGRYPPVIVRRLDEHRYQILDGHHRVMALRRLRRIHATCVIWDVDDDEALVLLATLNRLQGKDDPYKRGDLLASLREHHGTREMSAMLPERPAQVEALMALRRPPPPPRLPQPLETMPRAVTFFLLPPQRNALEARLKQIGGTREEALMHLVLTQEEMR